MEDRVILVDIFDNQIGSGEKNESAQRRKVASRFFGVFV